jgi:hypothetical protein
VHVGAKLAKLEGYGEIANQLPASIIEDSSKEVYCRYPFGGPQEYWMGKYDLVSDGAIAVIEGHNAFRLRFLTSLFGGYILIVPMLIMTLHPTLLTALLTTTAFVLAVAVIIAVRVKTAEAKELLTITAAYAAVLVVFVGTSTTTETLKRSVVASIVVGVLIGGTLIAFAVWYLIALHDRKKLEKESMGGDTSAN